MRKKLVAIVSCVCLLMLATMFSVSANANKTVDILFVHDMHSHLESFQTLMDGKAENVGGFSRLKTAIDAKK